MPQWGTSVRVVPAAAAWPLPPEPELPQVFENHISKNRAQLLGARAVPSAVTTLEQFARNWRCFTDCSLDELDWKNVLCAGARARVRTSLVPARSPTVLRVVVRRSWHT